MMYVVGATKAEMLAGIRRIVPDHFLLVPGVGAQGGSLEEVAKYGMNAHCGFDCQLFPGHYFLPTVQKILPYVHGKKRLNCKKIWSGC